MAVKENLDSFFDIRGRFAIEARITGPQFNRTIPRPGSRAGVIFDENSQGVALYNDTQVEVANPSFECKSIDLEGVGRGMTVTFPKLCKGDDGYGKTYEVARISGESQGTSRVHLKMVSQ